MVTTPAERGVAGARAAHFGFANIRFSASWIFTSAAGQRVPPGASNVVSSIDALHAAQCTEASQFGGIPSTGYRRRALRNSTADVSQPFRSAAP